MSASEHYKLFKISGETNAKYFLKPNENSWKNWTCVNHNKWPANSWRFTI